MTPADVKRVLDAVPYNDDVLNPVAVKTGHLEHTVIYFDQAGDFYSLVHRDGRWYQDGLPYTTGFPEHAINHKMQEVRP